MARLRPVSSWIWLVGLVAFSTGLRFWAGLRIPTPWIAPDELVYAALGTSLYDSGTLAVLGEPTRFYGLVTPLIVGPPLSLSDVGFGYGLLKLVQAFVMSLAAVPAFLWARRLTSDGWALIAAALTVAIPGLVYSGLVMTEVAFYPAIVLAAWAGAEAIERPTLARQALAVGAIVLASATRLQAAVLVPALVCAAAVVYVPQRRTGRMRAFWPSAAALAVLGAAWTGWALRHGGPATRVLGAYQAAGETDYSLGEGLRFGVYHLADLLLLTGVMPVLAVVLLLVTRKVTEPLRAYLAVTGSVSLWLLAVVAIFASRHVGYLAERNLFALAPLFFVGFSVWLGGGARRPRALTAAAGFAAVALVATLPLDRFVSLAAIPHSFTLIPLYRLSVRAPGVDLEPVLLLGVTLAVLAFALVPRRAIWLLPAALLATLAAVSVSASRVVAAQATLVQPGTVGPEPRWVDRADAGDAVYLYSGDVYWNSVWETIFWNRRVRRVYDLVSAHVPGPLPQRSVGPLEDGRIVLGTGQPVRARYVVASDSLRLVGKRIADAGNGVALWRVDPPFRVAEWTQNLRFDGTVERRAQVVAYACRGGALRLVLTAPGARTVELFRDLGRYQARRLAAGETWAVTVPALPRRPLGRRQCTFTVATDGPIHVSTIEFRRST